MEGELSLHTDMRRLFACALLRRIVLCRRLCMIFLGVPTDRSVLVDDDSVYNVGTIMNAGVMRRTGDGAASYEQQVVAKDSGIVDKGESSSVMNFSYNDSSTVTRNGSDINADMFIDDIDTLLEDECDILNDLEYIRYEGEGDEISGEYQNDLQYDEQVNEVHSSTSMQRTGKCRDDVGEQRTATAAAEGGAEGGDGEVGVGGGDNTRTIRGGSAANTAGGVKDGGGTGELCGIKRRQRVDTNVCPGQKRRLVTLSQWDSDARSQMLDALKFNHGVT